MSDFKIIPNIDEDLYISRSGILSHIPVDHCKPIPKKGLVDGFIYVNLKVGGKPKRKRLHRIIAELFLGNPNNYKDILFIDGDRNNIDSENLRWVKSVPRRKVDGFKLTREQVHVIKTSLQLGVMSKLLATKYGVSESLISRIKKGTRWSN